MKKKKKKKTAFDLDAALAAEGGETMEQQSGNLSAEDGKQDDAALDLDADLDLENFGKKKKKKKKPFMSLEEEQQTADAKDGEAIEPEEAGDGVEEAGDDLGFDFNVKKKKKKKKDLNDILKEEEQKDADKENGRSIYFGIVFFLV